MLQNTQTKQQKSENEEKKFIRISYSSNRYNYKDLTILTISGTLDAYLRHIIVPLHPGWKPLC